MDINFIEKPDKMITGIYRTEKNTLFCDTSDHINSIMRLDDQLLQEVSDTRLGQIHFTTIKKKPKSIAEWVSLGATMSQDIAKLKYKKVQIFMQQLSSESVAYYCLGIMQAAYSFGKYKSKKPDTIDKISIVCDHPTDAETSFAPLLNISKAQNLAKDFVNEPSNTLTPTSFKDSIKDKLEPLGCKVTVYNETQMHELGMDAFMGVSRGSEEPAFFVTMEWHGGNEDDTPYAFAGKGVTFDTGGISLKPSSNMHKMKYDMAGAATVVGLMMACCMNKIPMNIVAGVGLVENMPSGKAQKPGDVVKAMSGKTIEIHNTDAEGRMVLCDVLHHLNTTFAPKTIIDLATLTGAIIVSLGSSFAGLFSNDEKLTKSLLDAGQQTGERLWHMPLDEEYDKSIQSTIADLNHIGYDGAGSCTAAQFLSHFVDKTPWAHLDIAGVAWYSKKKNALPLGPSAFGVSMLYHWLMQQQQSVVCKYLTSQHMA